ncbi:MAG: amidase family protein, partial [Arenicellales bacterium]
VNEENSVIIDVVDLPAQFGDIYKDHRNIMETDLAASFAKEYRDSKSQLSAELCEMIERGQKVLATEYNASLSKIKDYSEYLNDFFDEYDAILTPSTPGAAPVGIDNTGSPIMNTIWTSCGNPVINLPLLQNLDGLPVGVQIVAGKGDDARLFRTSRWLLEFLND